MSIRLIACFCLFEFLCLTAHLQEPQKSVYSTNQGNDRKWILCQNNASSLYRLLCNEAFSQLDIREQKVSGLRTHFDWMEYNDILYNKLFSSLQQVEKTPLNAVITGIIRRDQVTVEKVVFESRPHFYVTGCLFIPVKRENPAPAIIYCSGHSENGFRSDAYQRVILNLVDKGFIVFAFDPAGQGERLQYADRQTGKSATGGPTTEHSFAGAQTLLTGRSLSDCFIWDGVRAVDYLLTHPEVDPQRIGITGRSGGGTQTAMIAAFDDRIYAAAPECYITSFRRLLQSVGPQDAEQNMYNAIAKGFDFPDYFHLRAPRPSLIITTTHDFFSIQGARETFIEAQKSYAAFGKPQNIRMTEDTGGHESTRANRETLYAFFRETLHLPGDNLDREFIPFSSGELRVTPTGQVTTSYAGETIFSLSRLNFREHPLSDTLLKRSLPEMAGIRLDRKLTAAVYTGNFSSGLCRVEKFFLENSLNDYALPVYVINRNKEAPGKLVVWLHPEGKEAVLTDSLALKLMDSGFTVISADLPGTGELRDPGFRGDGFVKGVPFNYTFGLNLTRNSVPGIQAEALDLLMQFLEKDTWFAGKSCVASASGTTCTPLLHYAVLRNRFAKLALLGCPRSAREFLNAEYYDPGLLCGIVPGSPEYYDFQDLVNLLPEGSCRIFDPVDAMNQRVGERSTVRDILIFLAGNISF